MSSLLIIMARLIQLNLLKLSQTRMHS